MHLHWGGSNSYVEISNLAALFGRKKSINHDTLVPSYFVIFLCPEVHHLTFWLFPRHLTAHWWHLSSLRSRWTWIAACIGPWNCCFTCTALTGVHPSAPASYQGRCLGPLWPSRFHVSLIPILRSFTFQFLHKWNFAVKFTSCSILHFIESNLLCWGFLIYANRIHICVIFSSLYFSLLCATFSGCQSGQYVLLAWLFLPVS